MIIKSIALQNFRNHKSTVLNLSSGINVLVGDNAQGKTNIIEAIYLTCVGRMFRSPRDREAIKFGENITRVLTTVSKKFGDINVEVSIWNSDKGAGGKQIKINEIPIAKMGELMGTVTCVFFSPDELKLVKEAPSDRRRFMDIDISQMDKVYFYNLLRYNKILQQRNALLKNLDPTIKDELRGLDIWDEQLATAATVIIERRLKFVEQLKILAKGIHKKLAPTEDIDIIYSNIEDIRSSLSAARSKDIRLRTTTVGPHRDDLIITINGKDVKTFASQGQQRTAALSLKLAELKVFEQLTGERPILLLDDVLSELDASRQQGLFEVIKDVQCIITTTKFKTQEDVKIFNIIKGCVGTL